MVDVEAVDTGRPRGIVNLSDDCDRLIVGDSKGSDFRFRGDVRPSDLRASGSGLDVTGIAGI